MNNNLAKYAVIEEKSRGRRFYENYNDTKYRSNFGRDRDRIIGSAAFRRLQYKTQVFVNYHGDHFRTRLTHSLEVAQIARWIASGLMVNKDLAEIVALAHDLGHPPFGHAGEEALNRKMREFGGFSHNAHTLKIVTEIESRFVEFRGLNLCWEVLEGIAKHNGPIDVDDEKTEQFFIDYNEKYDLDLGRFSSLEAQIAAIADDITYNNHDIEDGLRAELFNFEKLLDLPLIGEIYHEILQKYPKITRPLLSNEARKRLILKMVIDVVENSKNNLEKANITSEKDIRNHKKQLVTFSPQMQKHNLAIKDFLMKNMYRHREVLQMTVRAHKIVSKLFDIFMNNPRFLPKKYQILALKLEKKDFAILISDYIAGMTDRYATKLYKKLRHEKF